MPALETIKKLREETGAGMGDINRALEEANGDEIKALEILRKSGQKIMAKKADRLTKEGIVEAYLHSNARVGVLVLIACETDFVARNESFKEFAHEVALQVAATNPAYLAPEEIPAEVIEKEKEIYRAQLADSGKPTEMIEKIVEGKLDKFYAEVCLLNQTYIKDDSLTIAKLLEANIAKIGENIKIVKFVRMSIG